jgi:hypothetical protein
MAAQTSSCRRRWLILAACALLGGCGGATTAPVSGRVTYNGKPVTAGRIMFYPESGRAAVGQLGPDGRYTLTTLQPGDGALLGSHRVAIEATRVGPGSYQAPRSLEEEVELSRKGAPGGKVLVAGKVEWLVPEKYARPETSGLTATVRSGPNEINFDLPAKK